MKACVLFVVPLHNPLAESVRFVESMTEQAPVIAVDDGSSRTEFVELIGNLPNVELITLDANCGIARALNVGLAAAVEQGADAVITVDQDSDVPEGFVRLLRDADGVVRRTGQIALIGPALFGQSHQRTHNLQLELVLCTAITLIQSGMYIPLDLHRNIGGFEESLFIDGVDHEYCLRALAAGHTVMKVRGLQLTHALGAGELRYRHLRLGSRVAIATFHSPDRRYYLTRNTIRLAWRYRSTQKAWSRTQMKVLLAGSVAALVLEPSRLAKIGAMVEGMRDAFRGVTGRRRQSVTRPPRPD